jgi:hypothetical protein
MVTCPFRVTRVISSPSTSSVLISSSTQRSTNICLRVEAVPRYMALVKTGSNNSSGDDLKRHAIRRNLQGIRLPTGRQSPTSIRHGRYALGKHERVRLHAGLGVPPEGVQIGLNRDALTLSKPSITDRIPLAENRPHMIRS